MAILDEAVESEAPGGCPEPNNDLDQLMAIIVDEFQGDTSAFFESIREHGDKEDTRESTRDAIEAVAVSKLAKMK